MAQPIPLLEGEATPMAVGVIVMLLVDRSEQVLDRTDRYGIARCNERCPLGHRREFR